MTIEKNNERQPRILVFACKWCGLIGADGAGRNKVSLPLNFRVIPVECAAFVEPDAVIRALASGVDGVVVMGCHVGGCRFNNANHPAIKRLELLGDLFDATGVGRDRLMVSFGTAHEDHQFADVIRKYFNRIEQLEPLESWVTPLVTKY